MDALAAHIRNTPNISLSLSLSLSVSWAALPAEMTLGLPECVCRGIVLSPLGLPVFQSLTLTMIHCDMVGAATHLARLIHINHPLQDASVKFEVQVDGDSPPSYVQPSLGMWDGELVYVSHVTLGLDQNLTQERHPSGHEVISGGRKQLPNKGAATLRALAD